MHGAHTIFQRKHAPITSYDNFKTYYKIMFCFKRFIWTSHCKMLCLHIIRMCKKVNLNVIEKETGFLPYFFSIIREEIKMIFGL